MLGAVEALAAYQLRTNSSTGLVLDLESVLRRIPALPSLLGLKIFAETYLAE
jgi:hypothetical protein